MMARMEAKVAVLLVSDNVLASKCVMGQQVPKLELEAMADVEMKESLKVIGQAIRKA